MLRSLTDPTATDIREKAREILARPEFGDHENLFEKILRWLGDLFPDVSFGAGGGPGFLGNLVGFLMVAAIVVVIVLLIRALLQQRRGPKPDRDDDELTIEVAEGKDASDWRSDAERFEASGQWRDAMRARYRELVRTLIDDGVLEDLPGRTTGEYQREFIAARPSGAVPFSALTELFEAVWYGGHDTDATDNQRFRSLAAQARESQRADV